MLIPEAQSRCATTDGFSTNFIKVCRYVVLYGV